MRQATNNKKHDNEQDTEIINSLTMKITPKKDSFVDEDKINNAYGDIVKNGYLNLYSGFTIYSQKIEEIETVKRLHLYLRPSFKDTNFCCPKCGAKNSLVNYGTREIHVHDAPILNFQTHCHIKVSRYFCCACHTVSRERPKFLHQHRNITLNLYSYIRRELEHNMCHSSLEYNTGYSSESIRTLEVSLLAHENTVPDLSSTEYVGTDEHSVHVGHIYVTLVIEQTPIGDNSPINILYMAFGRKASSLDPFFNLLDMLGYSDKIKACSTDYTASYLSTMSTRLINCDCVGDLFHLVKRFEIAISCVKREIVDYWGDLAAIMELTLDNKQELAENIKKDLRRLGYAESLIESKTSEPTQEKIKMYQDMATMLKSERYGLNLGLEGLLASDLPIEYKNFVTQEPKALQLLKIGDKLRSLYSEKMTPDEAANIAQDLINECKSHRNRGMKNFGKFLDNHIDTLKNACKHRISNSIIEGVNSECKFIQHITRGVKDIRIYFARVFRHFRINKQKKLYKIAIQNQRNLKAEIA